MREKELSKERKESSNQLVVKKTKELQEKLDRSLKDYSQLSAEFLD